MKRKANLSFILACAGALGVAVTGFLAGRQTLKAREILEDEDLTVKQKIVKAAPVYIPAIAAGVGTIGCIFGGHIVNRKAQASLAGAYAMLGQSYSLYKDRVYEVCGPETAGLIEGGLESAHLTDENVCRSPEENGEKHWFYDEISGKTFERTWGEILDAEYHLNRNFVLRGAAGLDEFYRFLDISADGQGLTWDACEGYAWIDFRHRRLTTDDGMECYAVEYVFSPMTESELAAIYG